MRRFWAKKVLYLFPGRVCVIVFIQSSPKYNIVDCFISILKTVYYLTSCSQGGKLLDKLRNFIPGSIARGVSLPYRKSAVVF